MASNPSLRDLAADAARTRDRLAAIEAKLDRLLTELAEHDARMEQALDVRRPSAQGFSMAHQLDTIRNILEREFT